MWNLGLYRAPEFHSSRILDSRTPKFHNSRNLEFWIPEFQKIRLLESWIPRFQNSGIKESRVPKFQFPGIQDLDIGNPKSRNSTILESFESWNPRFPESGIWDPSLEFWIPEIQKFKIPEFLRSWILDSRIPQFRVVGILDSEFAKHLNLGILDFKIPNFRIPNFGFVDSKKIRENVQFWNPGFHNPKIPEFGKPGLQDSIFYFWNGGVMLQASQILEFRICKFLMLDPGFQNSKNMACWNPGHPQFHNSGILESKIPDSAFPEFFETCFPTSRSPESWAPKVQNFWFPAIWNGKLGRVLDNFLSYWTTLDNFSKLLDSLSNYWTTWASCPIVGQLAQLLDNLDEYWTTFRIIGQHWTTFPRHPQIRNWGFLEFLECWNPDFQISGVLECWKFGVSRIQDLRNLGFPEYRDPGYQKSGIIDLGKPGFHISEFWNVNFWNPGFQDAEMSKFWNSGIQDPNSFTKVGFWHVGIQDSKSLKLWNLGILESRILKFRIFGILESWIPQF